jgi:UDP-N-acetylmuramate dehydrogenase
MLVEKKYNLKNHNTFGIEAHCSAFVVVENEEDLNAVLAGNRLPIYVLGGGSNVLFTKPYYDFLFIKNEIKGIRKVGNIERKEIPKPVSTEGVSNYPITQLPNYQTVEVGGGEGWHDLVLWCLENDLGGIENLSLIPGTVGASPIQNIGAYGVELKDVFVKLEAINLQTLENQTFTHTDCRFGYRDSIFKQDLKGKYLITKVYLNLTKKDHKRQINYGDIHRILTEKNIPNPTIRDISDAVIRIRQSKLPDPSVLGNAGSFFKNPEITQAQFDALKNTFPNIVGYATEKGMKLAAGWLIEQSGWKGKRVGQVGVHERQALVLVNYGNGKGLEIKELAQKIQDSILQKFGVELLAEVNML